MADRSKLKELATDARRWVEQEKAWGNDVYATAGDQNGGISKAAASPDRQRKEVLLEESTRSRSGHPAVPVPRPSGTPPSEKAAALQALYAQYNTCTRCPLGSSRLKFVFGVGNPDADVLLIGEGPGYQEDHQGEPFVGRSGQLLDKMLDAIGMSRKTVYIANIVKCHPMVNPKTPEEHGNDRPPTPEEVATCSPILQQQIAVIQPKVIMTLGSPSTKAILGTQEGISKVRGKLYPMPMTFYKAQTGDAELFGEKKPDEFIGLTPEQLKPLEAIQVLPTYHPAALLRNPNLKKDAWDDLKLLKKTVETAQ